MSTKKIIATKIISERLQQLIDETGIKKGKLASKIGLTPGAISQMLGGKSGASAQTIKYLAAEFNVNEEWLEYGTGEKERKFEVTKIIIPETKKAEHTPIAEVILGVTDKLSTAAQQKALEFITALFISEQTKEKE